MPSTTAAQISSDVLIGTSAQRGRSSTSTQDAIPPLQHSIQDAQHFLNPLQQLATKLLITIATADSIQTLNTTAAKDHSVMLNSTAAPTSIQDAQHHCRSESQPRC